MRQRACRRPRPADPAPFGQGGPPRDKGSPGTPSPQGGLPLPSPVDFRGVDTNTANGDITLSCPEAASSDPLRHSGRWVPAKYTLCKELPWTGYWTCCGNKTAFTTQCVDLAARLRQREVEYQRSLAEQLNHERQRVAKEFRARWENGCTPASSISDDWGSSSSSSSSSAKDRPYKQCLAKGITKRRSRRQRPFLRQGWLQRLRRPSPEEAASAAQGGQARAPAARSAATRVRAEHVRSVIHVASSESRVNAFVAISSLEGLLSVVTQGVRAARVDGTSNLGDTVANEDGDAGFKAENYCGDVSRHGAGARREVKGGTRRHEEGCRSTSHSKDPSAFGGDCSPAHESPKVGNLPKSAKVAAESTNGGGSCIDRGSSRRRSESGAALCVRLGALPAVLGCLNQHEGHKQIEPLAISLLRIFASDHAASSAVRGNSGVAAACASRMFPVAAAAVCPVAGGSTSESGVGDGDGDGDGDGHGHGRDDIYGVSKASRPSSARKTRGAEEKPHERTETDHQGEGRVDACYQSPEAFLPIQDESSGKATWRSDQMPESPGAGGVGGDGSTAPAMGVGCDRTTECSVGSLALEASFVPARGSASTEHGQVSSRATREATRKAPAEHTIVAAASVPRAEELGGEAPPSPAEARERQRSRRQPQPQPPPPQPQVRLPTLDLVFVLSVAVKDSPGCQRLIIQRGGISAMLATLRRQVSGVGCGSSAGGDFDSADVYEKRGGDGIGDARLAGACLTVMGHLGQQERGRRWLVREGSVETAIATFGRFTSDDDVLGAATGLLLLLSDSAKGRGRILKGKENFERQVKNLAKKSRSQWARDEFMPVSTGCRVSAAWRRFLEGNLSAHMLSSVLVSEALVEKHNSVAALAGGISVVFEAMQRLVGNDELQVKGVEMLKALIDEEPRARHELNSIKGGWQWLCQGTSGGNALVRYAPGEKHIPGWTVSEEERLSTQEALSAAELVASDWTPHSLATFMRTMRGPHKLQIGNLGSFHLFRVVSEAGLLPHPHEEVENWRSRVRRYEDERQIRVINITRRRLARDRDGAHARSLGSSSMASPGSKTTA